jgi:Flp pilus assembly protein TadG
MKSKSERGAQIVEFALILPLLLAIMLLIIDFGFLVYNKAVITNASREAARAGTVLTATPWTTGSVAAVACTYARNSLITTTTGTHIANCSGTADPAIVVTNPNGNVPPHFGDPITVQVTYVYSGFLKNATGWITEAPWTLVATSTMNHE